MLLKMIKIFLLKFSGLIYKGSHVRTPTRNVDFLDVFLNAIVYAV